MQRLSHNVEKWEREVEQALTVMDQQKGKLLNYRQLRQDPKHKQDWSLSSANKFGRLANGIEGQIKNPTNNQVHLLRVSPQEVQKRCDVRAICVHSLAQEEREKLNKTGCQG